ncbi:MAG: histidine kinase, partial [Bacteroidota bacterium]|nr:histidine kinase [Bacteroidota bacterium]MDX5430156.1 histidine kinase [Bacteroidota bacterium]MDX5468915.1 histidine kinase [Bacteroidota bacterium]
GDAQGRFYQWEWKNDGFRLIRSERFDFRIHSLCHTAAGICAGTNRGLFFLQSDGSFMIRKDVKSNFRLPSNDINEVKCVGDLLLIATYGAGASYAFPGNSSIELYQLHVSKENSEFDAFIKDFTEDKEGIIWVASQYAIIALKPDGSFESINEKMEGTPLPHVAIRSIADAGEYLVVATGGKGLFIIRKGDRPKIIKHFSHREYPLMLHDFIFQVEKGNDGLFWLSTGNGVCKFDIQTMQFIKLPDPLHELMLNKRVWKVAEASNGDVYFSCPAGGILAHHKKENRTFWMNHGDESGFFDVYPDQGGNIWGAGQHGFYQFNRKGELISFLSDTNGLPSKVCYGILEDDKGHLWVSSNSGIFRYNKQTGTIEGLGIEDGLQDIEFNQEAFLKMSDGRLLFGGVNGFNRINPSTQNFDRKLGRLYFPKFAIDGRDTSSQINPISLSAGKHSLQLAFALINYHGNAPYQAFYRLGDESSAWQEIQPGRPLYIDQLPYGGDFSIQIRDLAGEVLEQRNWTFDIPPPWYQQMWFRLLVIVLLGMMIYAVYWYRLHQQASALELKAQIAELRMRSLRAQMNPHFIFNSMNSIQHLVIQQQSELAFHYLSGFSRLLRLILETSDQPVVDLDKEIDMIRLYLELEKLRFDNTLEVDIEIPEDLDVEDWTIPTLLIQPYVENAIWHGLLNKPDNRQLKIRFQEESEYLWCFIEDNGIGRERAREINSMRPIHHESKGLKIAEQRLELLGKESFGGHVRIVDLVKNGEAYGTRVEIRIPPEAKKYD